MARQFGVERVLVVCPTSLKHQWEREIARFTDRTAMAVGGLRGRREQHYAVADRFFKITNYDTVHSDLDLIGSWSPDLVILDEAQRIKNWNTRTARSVKRITSPYAIVLTGTPLENRLEELVSIIEFVDKHRLGPTFRFLADHQVRDEHNRVVGYHNLDGIGKAGVLDGGESEVFLGGSRLTRFMETVEKTTAAMAEPMVEDRDEARRAEPDVKIRPRLAPQAALDGWATLVQTGLTLLERLAAVSRASPDAHRGGLRFVQRDPQTGQDYLKIPMPSPEVLDRALQSIGTLLDRFRR
jgi:hypothetical protein